MNFKTSAVIFASIVMAFVVLWWIKKSEMLPVTWWTQPVEGINLLSETIMASNTGAILSTPTPAHIFTPPTGFQPHIYAS